MEIIPLTAFFFTVYVIMMITVYSIIKISRLAYKRKEINLAQYKICVTSSIAGGISFALTVPMISLYFL